MKSRFVFGFAAMMSLAFSSASFAHPVDGLVELPLEKVFAPESGFDDNDRIEIVAHGVLPNGCYRLEDAHVQRSVGGTVLEAEVFAVKSNEGVCAPGAQLPVSMAFEIPFTKVVEIGHLKAGTYTIHYNTERGDTETRTMNVAKAPAPTPDTLAYAAVTSLVVSDIIPDNTTVKVTLAGLLNSTCAELAKNVIVQKSNDVIVLLPTLKINEDVDCKPAKQPFAKIVDLGKLAAGDYLIYTRSMDGSSLSHVIQVTSSK
jgi:hypothetical protein